MVVVRASGRDHTAAYLRYDVVMDNYSTEADHSDDSSNVRKSGHSGSLKDAVESWENEVTSRLEELRSSADKLETLREKHQEAEKEYRNLYRKAETDGIIRVIGKSALKDAGIPTPVQRRKRRRTSTTPTGDSDTTNQE